LTVGFREDLIGGSVPDEWVGAVVQAGDERLDRGGEFADVAEGSAMDGLAFDDAEPDLDKIEPGCRRRSEMDVDARVGGEPVADLDAFGE
jgi:hypothetical protein